ncbi:MAG: hypothetical protein U0R21_08460 [Nocardioidaceae bacterium]
MIDNLIDKADRLLIGGGMVFTFSCPGLFSGYEPAGG